MHNSPSKSGYNVEDPQPCQGTVTNTAVATATLDSQRVAAVDAAIVEITGPPAAGADDIEVVDVELKKNKLTVKLTNTSSYAATIEKLELMWPATNKKLKKIKLGGETIFEAKRESPATITTFANSK